MLVQLRTPAKSLVSVGATANGITATLQVISHCRHTREYHQEAGILLDLTLGLFADDSATKANQLPRQSSESTLKTYTWHVFVQ